MSRLKLNELAGIAFSLCPVLVLLSVLIANPVCGHDLNDLLKVEAKVQQVAKQKMNVVVAVTDGIGYGSGVIVSEDGLVLTAGHVLLTGGSDFRVIFPDGREAKAEPWGRNLNVDAGMVRITEEGPWEHAEIGDASTLKEGDWCVCLGHSGGYELGRRPPVRAGRILAFEPDQMVTDCVLIGGDSGGPLFDLEGRVIGIHSSIGSSIAENRHVSIGTFKKHWDRMITGTQWGQLPELAGKEESKPSPSESTRPSMGIRVDRQSNIAKILLVHPGKAAEMAGLLPGDIVTEFGESVVLDSKHLIELIAACKAGEEVSVTIQRGEEQFTIPVILGQR